MSEHHLASTATLVLRAQAGEDSALDLLMERCSPLLRRWAKGRLPVYGRDLSETDDLVQSTLTKGFQKINEFEPRTQGAYLAYLRQIFVNTVRDEIRKSVVRSGKRPLDEERPPAKNSAEERAHGLSVETLKDYERSLAKLPMPQQQAVVLRLEFGMTFAEVAAELDLASAEAARMSVTRGVKKLACLMS